MRVIRNYLYTILYQVSAVVIPFIIVPYVSRVLEPSGIGVVSYTNSITQYFVLLGNFGLATYGSRCIAQCRDDLEMCSRTFREIMSLKVGITSFALLCFGLFVAFTHTYQNYFLAQSLLIISSALDTTWFFAGKENFKITAFRSVAVKLVGMTLVFLLVRTKNDVMTYIVILAASDLLGNLSLLPLVRTSVVKIRRNSINIRRHVKPALIFFVSYAAIQMYFILNKSLLGWISGVEACGFFENSDKVVRLCLLIVVSIGTVLMPRISYTYAKGEIAKAEEYLRKSLQYTLLIAIPIALGMSAIGTGFAPLFFGSKFQLTGELIALHALMILPMGLTTVFGSLYFLPTNQMKPYTISAISALAVNIVSGVLLIWKFGAFGAVISSILTEITAAVYQTIVVSKRLDIKKMFRGCLQYCLAGVIMYVAVWLLSTAIKATIINILLEIFLGAIIYAVAILILRPPVVEDIKQRLKLRLAK